MSVYNNRSNPGFLLFMLLSACIIFNSCISVKKYVYFRDLPDTTSKTIVIDQVTPFVDPKIETSDILSITVQPMLKNLVSGPDNNSDGSGASKIGNGLVNLFPVDKNGYIEYSLIGRIKVAGLSTSEAREVIREKSLYYYKDPVVNVRITNFDITILGDVNKPGRINSESEKFSIIDAIAESGDLLTTAKRNNILLIRSEGDQKIFARYDIANTSIFNNPYYYLKQRDIIYVEPNKYKVQSSDQSFIRNLGILSSIISLASLILVYRSIK